MVSCKKIAEGLDTKYIEERGTLVFYFTIKIKLQGSVPVLGTEPYLIFKTQNGFCRSYDLEKILIRRIGNQCIFWKTN